LEFGSIDDRPVDLIAALVVPAHFTNLHLQLLAELAEIFSDVHLTATLRACADASALRAELAEFAATRS
jgi:PTS system nitrogen regulatory IIA component